MKLLSALCAPLLLATPAAPCSAFLVVGDGLVLYANNEDYSDPETRLWFVPPEEGCYGAMYLGYANRFPQGGMNEKGLCFDGFATAERLMEEQEGKSPLGARPIERAMETCATVGEVVAFFEAYDLRPLLTHAMLQFADASGDAVILEGDTFLRKTGDFQVVTNFYQSAQEDDLAQCPRYAAAVGVLAERESTSVEVCEEALSAAAQRGKGVATLYSNVFDLKRRKARIYLFHDFERAVELDLAEELAKGERSLRLPDLFPANVAFESFAARNQLSLEERIAARRGPELSEAQLEAFTGAFRLELIGLPHNLSLRREGVGLVAESTTLLRSSGGSLVLHSASADEFFAITSSGEVTLRFARDEEGRVTGFTLLAGGRELVAERVREEEGR